MQIQCDLVLFQSFQQKGLPLNINLSSTLYRIVIHIVIHI
ncbi:unnamed protein product [Brassica oleracea]